FLFLHARSTPRIYTLSLHDALPISDVLALEEAIGFAVRQQPTIEGYRLAYWSLDNSLGADQSQLRGRENVRRMIADPSVLGMVGDRKSTRLNSSHLVISYAVFCLKK